MKILKCDQCGSKDKDVKTYTVNNQCLNLKIDYSFYTCGTSILYPKEKEFCDDCASIIKESYKHFLEENVP